MPTILPGTILHPVRMRILATISGRHLTTQQIASALPDVAQATLYRHLNRLMTARVISVVEERRVRGVTEKVYAVTEGTTSVNLDITQMTRADWERGFSAYAASLIGQFDTYIRQEKADPFSDGVSFRTAPVYLSDTELMQFFAQLRDILATMLSQPPSPERRRRLFSTVLIPDVVVDADTDTIETIEQGES